MAQLAQQQQQQQQQKHAAAGGGGGPGSIGDTAQTSSEHANITSAAASKEDQDKKAL
jgi:hypothetical protein